MWHQCTGHTVNLSKTATFGPGALGIYIERGCCISEVDSNILVCYAMLVLFGASEADCLDRWLPYITHIDYS